MTHRKNLLRSRSRDLLAACAALAICSCAGTDDGSAAAADAPATGSAAKTGVPAAERFAAELKTALADGDSDLAAYLAEYVLNLDELVAFVDKNFPAARGNAAIDSPAETAREIRYTLARRLLREGRWAQARAYFPEELLPTFDAYVRAIQRGYAAELPDAERARAFWDAALIVRNDGDALFLAASGPVYIADGEWDEGAALKARLPEAGHEERSRAASRDVSRFVNDRRFRAAVLARNAASLLPNNDERTARLLCAAGVWLRYRDPKTADTFYKAIVIRCPQTALGKRCDALRWFPPSLPWTDAEAWDGVPAAAPTPPPAPDADEKTH